MPWLGRSYFKSRIVLLGINFNNFGGLAGNYWICEDHIEQMRRGKRGKDDRPFSRNAMLYLGTALASMRRDPLVRDLADVSNEDLADLWEDCAYVEAIKCAPGTERSYPTRSMFERCPAHILSRELSILEPKLILLFGRTTLRDSIRPWAVPRDGYGDEQGPRIERDVALVGDRKATLISLNHPSSHATNVRASLDQLTGSLEAKPL